MGSPLGLIHILDNVRKNFFLPFLNSIVPTLQHHVLNSRIIHLILIATPALQFKLGS